MHNKAEYAYTNDGDDGDDDIANGLDHE